MTKKLSLYFILLSMLAACSEDSDFPGAIGSFDSNSGGNPAIIITSEQYNTIVENPFISVSEEAISTFSIDADGGAYGNMRRFLEQGQIPPSDAIRTEELINYFNYNYAEPNTHDPISLEGEVSDCPWNKDHKLMRIGIKGEHMEKADYPASNIVFLIDISGSMSSTNKLPMLKEGIKLMVEELTPEDRISIVTYASNPGTALPPTAGDDKEAIIRAVDRLSSGGSTNGEGGIKTAYELAEESFIPGGNNRIIMGTDGDFNVGISSEDELIELIEEEREKGIFLTVIGLGQGNLKEGRMEQLADNGNGTYEYIDDLDQARKVFVEEYNKFFTVAKDVKVQVEFNPQFVSEYRLIGYENRVLETEDFDDDQKDAGEIGAGQSITALYELRTIENAAHNISAFDIDFRYKQPDGDVSQLMNLRVLNSTNTFTEATDRHQFAAAVASFGLLLRDSQYKGDATYEDVKKWAAESISYDPFGYKRDFLDLVDLAR